jgi:hypothetical protein
MKSSFKLVADSDVHAACHRLVKALLEAFPGSVLHQKEHDIRCTICRYDGTVTYNDESDAFSFSQGLGREIDVEIVSPNTWIDTLLLKIRDTYAAKLDAHKSSHTLRVNQVFKSIPVYLCSQSYLLS